MILQLIVMGICLSPELVKMVMFMTTILFNQEVYIQNLFLFKLNSDGNLIWGTNAITFGLVRGRAISINGNEVAVSPDFHMFTWAEGSYPVVPNGGADASIFRFNKTTGAYIDKTKLSSANGASEVIGYMTTDVFGNLS